MADPATKQRRSPASRVVMFLLCVIVAGALLYALAIMFLLIGMSVFGESGLDPDEDDPFNLSISVPDGPSDRRIRFGEQDAANLGLFGSEHIVDPYEHGTTHLSVRTGATYSEVSDGYCFVDPIMIIGPREKATLVEPGECTGWNGRLVRRGINVASPAAGSHVQGSVTVDARIDPDLHGTGLRFFVDGTLVHESSADASSRTVLGLDGVEPGPFTVRIELVSANEELPRAAQVVELINDPPAS